MKINCSNSEGIEEKFIVECMDQNVKIKICGITLLEDAFMATALGADALGFVFARSKRHISLSEARKIISRLPAFVTAVGVFMNQSFEDVRRIADETGIDVIQLHGSETPEYCEQLDRPIIKRFAVQLDDTAAMLASRMKTYTVAAYLLDPGAGEGKVFDWEKAVGLDFRLIIAGGLTHDNVRQVIQLVKPYGVDVSSGVERSPGRKDREKMKRFIEEVK
ncbi:phosphoribosylanthranilate isomerase [bacterium]|nr:phosphoribosylanthranilate isomerase [bacterium]